MDYIKQFVKKENLVGYGSSRIVFDLEDGYVAKIPYNNLGILANKIEYEYFLNNKEIVAQIKQYESNIIIQEKLYSLIIVPFEYTVNKNEKEYLDEKYPQIDFSKLLEKKLFSRMQMGLDRYNNPKFFDYEDSKLKNNLILPPFQMDEKWLKVFFEHYKTNDILQISEHETFEDCRGFLLDYNL